MSKPVAIAWISLLVCALIVACAPVAPSGSAPSARPQITDSALAATSESSLVNAQMTVDAATAIAVQQQVENERMALTAGARIAQATTIARATQDAAAVAAQSTAIAQATLDAEATRMAQATFDARAAVATDTVARMTGTAQAQAAQIAATATQAWSELQLTRVAATAIAEQRQQEREKATDLFWTWFPIVLIVGLVILLIVAARIGLQLLNVRGRVVNGEDGLTSLVLDLPGKRGYAIVTPSKNFWPSLVIDGEARNLPVSERAQSALVAQDNATRAIRGLPDGSAGRSAAPLVVSALARPQPTEPDQLMNVVVLDGPSAQSAPDIIPPRLLGTVERDWSETHDRHSADDIELE